MNISYPRTRWRSVVAGVWLCLSALTGFADRIYCVTTKNFTTFSPTKLFYDGGFNVIDVMILPAKGKYYLIVKDETKNPVKKHLRLAASDNVEGPYGTTGPAISGDWVEGPSGIQMGSEFYIYFDHYGDPKYYGGHQIVGHGTLAGRFGHDVISERFPARHRFACAGGFGEKFVIA